ncbi:biotin--[acetyl-CoA-carboxylase] ligase [Lactobacillus sp. ESL0679]|uniref:biotin--[acetyl-CoA-carboxylase] ligase n=1 Tax=Lactobacillus sp. ESL0679 TaxID=2983209 RepID=UPI0023F72634|nr:biotin--[acetyl-CoA-carboxylase] ligase [Lactobacillus sp. ESL0679]MDF7682891.1 biotin--[acetyl-CoA-carboxylase] ligase [Lactobacillus sp. ESL0679]
MYIHKSQQKINIIKEQELKHLLADLLLKIHWYYQVTSTNNLAKQYNHQKSITQPVLIGSDTQTAGYGKQQRHFISNTGGVYLSLLTQIPQLSPQNQGLLTTGIAWQLHETIRQQFDINTDIKWVNDLLLHSKKVAGILTEQIAPQTVVIGIGCNLYQHNLEQELESSTNLLTRPLSTKQFCIFVAELIKNILSFLPNFTQGQFLSDYQKHLPMLEQKVTVKLGEKTIMGTAVRLDEHANLILDCNNHCMTINSGEVVKIRPN